MCHRQGFKNISQCVKSQDAGNDQEGKCKKIKL